MVTAYDYPSAIHVARAGIDVILVGDSLAMVELGHETTQPVSMAAMIHHCAAVKRGVTVANVTHPPLLVGDLPFGTYEFDDTDVALRNAYRFVKEAGMDAVKLEVRRIAGHFFMRIVFVTHCSLLRCTHTHSLTGAPHVCSLCPRVSHGRAAARRAPARPARSSTAASPSWATWA